jgi:hypothetical protein
MSDIAIVIAKKEGGLDAALKDSGYKIIAGTKRNFTSLTTLPDVPSKGFGHIDTGESGWMALAEYP